VIQRQPDPNASGNSPAIAPPQYSVVEKEVKIASAEELPDILGLPHGTIPPGAETNPQFLMSVLGGNPDAEVSRLEEVLDVPEEVLSTLPDGQVVEVAEGDLFGLGAFMGEEEAPPSPTGAIGAVKGADQAVSYNLARKGFASAGPNAVGIVAFPQSKVVHGAIPGPTFGQFGGPGPLLPESRIILGHTAIYVRIDNQIQLIRSFASESLVEAGIKLSQVRSGTGGVPARIIDHLGEAYPPGGRMFDITSGHSIEYPVPKELAADLMNKLPAGGELPGEFYTAQPDMAAQLGQARLAKGRNCVHWAVSEVEAALGTAVGPDGKSVLHMKAPDAARQGKMMGYLQQQGTEKVKLGSGEAVTPVRGQMSKGMKVFKWGGRIFNVAGIGFSAYRIANAPDDQLLEVIGEEAGGLAGGSLGAAAGVTGCVALGLATGGLGLLLCGIGGGLAGGMGGSALGGGIGGAIQTLLRLPELLASGLATMMEVMEFAGDLAGMPFQFMVQHMLASREQMNPENWDLRYFPESLQNDARLVGVPVWQVLGPLKLNDLLAKIKDPLQAYPVPPDAVGRIADALTKRAQEQGNSSQAYSAADLLAKTPLEFTQLLQEMKLTYIQDPAYIAGIGGRYENEQALRVHLYPLVRSRATVNAANWDTSHLPWITMGEEGAEDEFDLGDAVASVGSIVWSQLSGLSEEQLPAALQKPLSEFQVPDDVLEDVAEGISQVYQQRLRGTEFSAGKLGAGLEFSVEGDSLRQMTPERFVQFLHEYQVDLRFIRQPSEIAELSLQWVRAGFQPW
jgi:hypothetical protein